MPQPTFLQGPVLVVDDDENDLLLVKQTFDRAGLSNSLHAVKGGSSAIAYLSGDAPYHDRTRHPTPALVLLDIKMPGIDGYEVLKWIRQQPRFESLPVVMLTASDEIRLVNNAYELGATSFLVKPLEFWNASELMRSLERATIHARKE